MSPLRKLAVGLAGAALLLLGLVLAAQTMLDDPALARMAEDKVRSSLQRELELRDLRVRLLPTPTITVSRLSLSNAAWASQPQLLQAEDVRARLEWLPLLQRRLVLSGLSARQLRLNLETDEQGRNGWDLPQSDKPAPRLDRLRHAELGAATVWRKNGKQAPEQWQLQGFKASGEPGWKAIALSTAVLANKESVEVKLKLADASAVGQPGASSEGEAELQFKDARLQVSGRLPLGSGLENYALKATLQAKSLATARRFFGADMQLPTAPLEVEAQVRREQAAHLIESLKLTLGRQSFSGSASLHAGPERWRLQGKAQGERLDWEQTMLDLGNAPVPQKPEHELLPTRPFPWPMLGKLQAIDADIDARVSHLVTRNGLLFKQWRGKLQWNAKGIALADTSFELLGGKGSGQLQLDPQRREATLQLQAQHLMLEEWFRAERKSGPMVGEGPLDLKADVRSRGNSWKELGANLAGPVSIRLGPMTLHSRQMREAETLLVNLLPAFAEDKAEQVRVQCLASELHFAEGRAQSRQALGVRSQASKLLLGGSVDLRRQTVDLAGRVRAAEGVSLGIATLAGDVRIAGPLVKPQVSVEPVGALARVGAAIVTSGLSVLATAAYDAATGREDPCAIASGALAVKPRPAPRAAARTPDTR